MFKFISNIKISFVEEMFENFQVLKNFLDFKKIEFLIRRDKYNIEKTDMKIFNKIFYRNKTRWNII